MNNPYRISLSTHWKLDGRTESDAPNRMEIQACRSFHRPSGLSNCQTIRFCLQPAPADLHVVINRLSRPLVFIGDLGTVPITDWMESINRVVLHWRGDPMETPRLPEHFAAWLEISDHTL